MQGPYQNQEDTCRSWESVQVPVCQDLPSTNLCHCALCVNAAALPEIKDMSRNSVYACDTINTGL